MGKKVTAGAVILAWALSAGVCPAKEKGKNAKGYHSSVVQDLARQMNPQRNTDGTSGATGNARDPFSVTDTLMSKIKQDNKKEGREALEFLPNLNPSGIPKLKLRGHLTNGKNGAVALLEIQGGGVYIVREGDTVGLHDLGYDSVIRIQKIDRLHLVVESGSLGKVIIVR